MPVAMPRKLSCQLSERSSARLQGLKLASHHSADLSRRVGRKCVFLLRHILAPVRVRVTRLINVRIKYEERVLAWTISDEVSAEVLL